MVLVLVACGTQHATSSHPLAGPSSSPSAKPSFPECPRVPGVVDPSPCASVGAEQNQQANQTFNSRIPLPAPVAAEAAVFKGAASDSVGFGGYELGSTRPAVCAWGTVSVKTIDLESGGITREGGCLPSAGGH